MAITTCSLKKRHPNCIIVVVTSVTLEIPVVYSLKQMLQLLICIPSCNPCWRAICKWQIVLRNVDTSLHHIHNADATSVAGNTFSSIDWTVRKIRNTSWMDSAGRINHLRHDVMWNRSASTVVVYFTHYWAEAVTNLQKHMWHRNINILHRKRTFFIQKTWMCECIHDLTFYFSYLTSSCFFFDLPMALKTCITSANVSVSKLQNVPFAGGIVLLYLLFEFFSTPNCQIVRFLINWLGGTVDWERTSDEPAKIGSIHRRVISKMWKTVRAACRISRSTLMDECNGKFHAQCCHWLAADAVFTTSAEACLAQSQRGWAHTDHSWLTKTRAKRLLWNVLFFFLNSKILHCLGTNWMKIPCFIMFMRFPQETTMATKSNQLAIFLQCSRGKFVIV